MSQPDARQTLQANVQAATALLAKWEGFVVPLERAAGMILEALLTGHKLLCCGNGGSAADCAHFTAEIAARYRLERPGFPAIDLAANHSLTTALINDYPPPEVFARQVRALGTRGDVLVAISTSGGSENIRLAMEAACADGIGTVALLGRDGGRCKNLADVELLVPSDTTARIQEGHQFFYHTICDLIDPALAQAAEGADGHLVSPKCSGP